MKHEFSFSPKGPARRSVGQTVAAAVMALVIAVSGAGTTVLYISQPSGLTVEPASVEAQQYSETESDIETSPEEENAQPAETADDEQSSQEAEQPAASAATASGEGVSAEPEPASEAVSQPEAEQAEPAAETPAASSSDNSGKLDMTGGDIEEENAKVGRFVPETPELAAEDPLAAPASYTEASDAAERAAQSMEENPVLLTPEQMEQALDEGVLSAADDGQAEDLSGENCLAWLWEWLFGSSASKYSGWRTDSSGNTYYYDQNTHEALTGIHTIDGVLYYFNADGVMQDVTFGIDVSKYQTNINWQKVKTSGVEFVIIRVGYRGYSSGTLVQDPMFEEHYTNASNAGLRIGVYAFSQAVNEDEAREEAQACVYVLNGRKLDYPIYFDTEASGASDGSGRADGLSAADRTKCAVAFCEEVKALGYQPGVYASTRWFNKRLDMSQLTGYSIWNAHYNVAQCGVDCDIWQGTCEGSVNGYSGSIDVNVSFIG